MKVRLQKLISSAGIASRRKAEAYIYEGRVKVNGETATLGQSADLDIDTVTVDGVTVAAGAKVYIMLNKPRAYVTTLSDEHGRKTVAELVTDVGVRLFPVGRLDMDSEGLLIMTNDGEAAYRMTHPSHEVPKTYHAHVAPGSTDIEAAAAVLRSEMEIDGYKIRPAEVQILRHDKLGTEISVTIHEGRNRQVRKMCARAGLAVLRLIRISEGDLLLGSLPVGKWRRLTKDEINSLQI